MHSMLAKQKGTNREDMSVSEEKGLMTDDEKV
jgi:hypothetical protein